MHVQAHGKLLSREIYLKIPFECGMVAAFVSDTPLAPSFFVMPRVKCLKAGKGGLRAWPGVTKIARPYRIRKRAHVGRAIAHSMRGVGGNSGESIAVNAVNAALACLPR